MRNILAPVDNAPKGAREGPGKKEKIRTATNLEARAVPTVQLLRNMLDSLQSAVSNIQDDVNLLKTENIKLQERVTSLETENIKLRERVTFLETKIYRLQKEITLLKTENIELQYRVRKLGEGVSNLQQIVTLSAAVYVLAKTKDKILFIIVTDHDVLKNTKLSTLIHAMYKKSKPHASQPKKVLDWTSNSIRREGNYAAHEVINWEALWKVMVDMKQNSSRT